jgi:putative sterol carrier protein
MRYDAPLSVDSLVLSLRALFDASAAAGFDADVVLILGEQRFRLGIANQRLDVSRNGDQDGDVVFDTDPATLLAILRGERSISDAVAAGTLRLQGDSDLAERFRGLFPLPEPLPMVERT